MTPHPERLRTRPVSRARPITSSTHIKAPIRPNTNTNNHIPTSAAPTSSQYYRRVFPSTSTKSRPERTTCPRQEEKNIPAPISRPVFSATPPSSPSKRASAVLCYHLHARAPYHKQGRYRRSDSVHILQHFRGVHIRDEWKVGHH